MKYWWLKKYRGLKIKLIPELTRDVNSYLIMPKHYKDRYLTIKNSDISMMLEEDLRIMLYSILNHEKIKNNKVILIIDRLLEIPDDFLCATDYSLDEMLEEIKNLKTIHPYAEKLSSNNIAACPICLQVFYIDKIKYVNKKGYCLCPYCKSCHIYFDNDFIPMDDNFLRLTKLIYDITPLGCKFKNIQRLLKKCVKLKKEFPLDEEIIDAGLIQKSTKEKMALKNNYIHFQMEEVSYKRQITSKEEMLVNYHINEYFDILENNFIKKIVIDTSVISADSYVLNISLLLKVLESLGRNPYLKEVVLVASDKKTYNLYKAFITSLLHYS